MESFDPSFPQVGLSLAAHAYVQPYQDNFLNRLEFGTLVASFVAVPWKDLWDVADTRDIRFVNRCVSTCRTSRMVFDMWIIQR